jgi:hypothetical protein
MIRAVGIADYRLSLAPIVDIDPDWLRDAYVGRGRSCADIGREVGVSATTIDRRLHALGIPARDPGVVGGRRDPLVLPGDMLTKKFLSDALGRKKLSLRQIGRQTGFSAATVSSYAHQHGIPIPGQRHDIDRDQLAELVERGFTVFQIAARLGCGHGTVERRLSAFGLSTRRRVQIDKETLVELYAERGLSMARVAAEPLSWACAPTPFTNGSSSTASPLVVKAPAPVTPIAISEPPKSSAVTSWSIPTRASR